MSFPNGRHGQGLEDKRREKLGLLTYPPFVFHSLGSHCVLSLPKATALARQLLSLIHLPSIPGFTTHSSCPSRPGMIMVSCCYQSLGTLSFIHIILQLNLLGVLSAYLLGPWLIQRVIVFSKWRLIQSGGWRSVQKYQDARAFSLSSRAVLSSEGSTREASTSKLIWLLIIRIQLHQWPQFLATY